VGAVRFIDGWHPVGCAGSNYWFPSQPRRGYPTKIPEGWWQHHPKRAERSCPPRDFLSAKMERALVALWRYRGDPLALHVLVESHRPLVKRMALQRSRATGYGVTLSPRVVTEYGLFALADEAADRWDGSTRFNTYGRFWASKIMTWALNDPPQKSDALAHAVSVARSNGTTWEHGDELFLPGCDGNREERGGRWTKTTPASEVGWQLLKALLSPLTKRNWEIVVLYYYWGFTQDELAAAYSMSRPRVQQIVSWPVKPPTIEPCSLPAKDTDHSARVFVGEYLRAKRHGIGYLRRSRVHPKANKRMNLESLGELGLTKLADHHKRKTPTTETERQNRVAYYAVYPAKLKSFEAVAKGGMSGWNADTESGVIWGAKNLFVSSKEIDAEETTEPTAISRDDLGDARRLRWLLGRRREVYGPLAPKRYNHKKDLGTYDKHGHRFDQSLGESTTRLGYDWKDEGEKGWFAVYETRFGLIYSRYKIKRIPSLAFSPSPAYIVSNRGDCPLFPDNFLHARLSRLMVYRLGLRRWSKPVVGEREYRVVQRTRTPNSFWIMTARGWRRGSTTPEPSVLMAAE
jgi:hypothetical protein